MIGIIFVVMANRDTVTSLTNPELPAEEDSYGDELRQDLERNPSVAPFIQFYVQKIKPMGLTYPMNIMWRSSS